MSEQNLPNIHVLLEKIKDLVDSVPSEQNDRIDWNRLKQQKEVASLALKNLFTMFGNPEIKATDPCKFENPQK